MTLSVQRRVPLKGLSDRHLPSDSSALRPITVFYGAQEEQGRLSFWGALDGSLAAIGGRIGRYSGAVETNIMGDERTVPVTLSTYVGKERLSGSPADIPVKDLYAFFTFMGQDRAAIPATSAPVNCLGLALTLCMVKYLDSCAKDLAGAPGCVRPT